MFFERLVSIKVHMPLAGGLRWKRLITQKPACVFPSANTNLDSDQQKFPAVLCCAVFFLFCFFVLLVPVEVEAAVQVPPLEKHNNDLLHGFLFFVFIY